jgi:hypothetical protein
MPDPDQPGQQISPLFLNRFRVDESSPFTRYLNRLEVEIAGEDYQGLKRLELLRPAPPQNVFDRLEDITATLLQTSQNSYNCRLIREQGIRIYLDPVAYSVYYRLSDRCIHFIPAWRDNVLRRFFGKIPVQESAWVPCDAVVTGYQCRFMPDHAGGALLLQNPAAPPSLPLLTVSHGPYDPHTLEVALYFLRYGKGRAALINLGFSGREPLTDDNLQRLRRWGVPLNPSNIDVIYPYIDRDGHPNCYKHERNLCHYIDRLTGSEPRVILDVHGYVGTHPQDDRILVGMGGLPPYPQLNQFGTVEQRGTIIHLQPHRRLRQGLEMVRELSGEIYVQLCLAADHCCHFSLLGGLQLIGRSFDPRQEVSTMLAGEERNFLRSDNIRWLPSAGANALQRMQAVQLDSRPLCLHVEIPTRIRQRIAVQIKQQAVGDSYLASQL